MDKFFTKTFFRFLTTFLAILAIAFGVLTYTAHEMNAAPNPVDTTATPQ